MLVGVAGVGFVRGLRGVPRAGGGGRGPWDGPPANERGQARKGTLTPRAKAGEPATKPPHRDFFLDGLLR